MQHVSPLELPGSSLLVKGHALAARPRGDRRPAEQARAAEGDAPEWPLCAWFDIIGSV